MSLRLSLEFTFRVKMTVWFRVIIRVGFRLRLRLRVVFGVISVFENFEIEKLIQRINFRVKNVF